MKKKVYLPVIAYGGMCRAEYSMSMASLFVKCLNDHADVSFLSTGILFESLVSRARNSAAAAALHYGTDYLLFIDSDVVFDAKDVFKLLAHDKDVVSGIYPKKYLNCSDSNFSLNDTIDDSFIRVDDSNIFEKDIKKSIYKQYLKGIGNYRMEELKQIAIDLNIPIYENNKIRKKQNIYNDINLNQLNLIN